MTVVVTGGMGFIGSNVVSSLIAENKEVIVLDNLSTGDKKFLSQKELQNIDLHIIDIAREPLATLSKVFKKTEKIYHLAANADVRGGWNSTFRDIEDNIIGTHNIMLAARNAGVSEVVFASTGCVYGDAVTIPTPEIDVFPIQTSMYGASKIAAEGIISTFAANGTFKATSFRFVSVLGSNYHHGHVIDFVRKLNRDPEVLNVLGDGKQKKSYIDVRDCVNGLLTLRGREDYEVFNIGNTDYISVSESAKIISEKLGLNPKYLFGEKDRGWIGDSPFTFLDISKAKSNGWAPKYSIKESIENTVEWIMDNKWVLQKTENRK